MNQLELYKLVTGEYVDEFHWEDDSFLVWVNYFWIREFIENIARILGDCIFDDGSFSGNMQRNCICIDLCDIVDKEELLEIFPKDEDLL